MIEKKDSKSLLKILPSYAVLLLLEVVEILLHLDLPGISILSLFPNLVLLHYLRYLTPSYWAISH